MRNRHFPRLCRTCDSPMSRQEDKYGHCGAIWDSTDDRRPNTSRVIPEPSADREHARRRRMPATVAADAGTSTMGQLDRWKNEGGSLGHKKVVVPPSDPAKT
jgi:hypothetical protein